MYLLRCFLCIQHVPTGWVKKRARAERAGTRTYGCTQARVHIPG